VPGLPVAPVFLEPAAVHRDLHPYPGEEEIRYAARWLDADHDAVRPVCRHHHKVGGTLAGGAEKLAVHEQHPEDAVRGRPASAARRANRET
jgi:hypothetical protein